LKGRENIREEKKRREPIAIFFNILEKEKKIQLEPIGEK